MKSIDYPVTRGELKEQLVPVCVGCRGSGQIVKALVQGIRRGG